MVPEPVAGLLVGFLFTAATFLQKPFDGIADLS
jgi:hypothetical protein